MALKKEIINEVGQGTTYHRIKNLSVDFVLGQVHIDIASYAGKKYRDMEKQQEDAIENKIKRYYELKPKMDLYDEKIQTLSSLKILDDMTEDEKKEIEAKKVSLEEEISNIVTKDEMQEFSGYIIQELEKHHIDEKFAKVTHYTLNLTTDWRAELYDRIKQEIPDFVDSLDV